MSFRQQTMLLIMLDLKWQMKPLITPNVASTGTTTAKNANNIGVDADSVG